jgi:hypothetical protein
MSWIRLKATEDGANGDGEADCPGGIVTSGSIHPIGDPNIHVG